MNRKSWAVVIMLGLAYFVIGIGFGEWAKVAASQQSQFRWRLAAWLVSAGVYAAHIGYEQLRFRNRPLVTALHVALAVALGGFLLAVTATAHALSVRSHAPVWLYLIAFVLWPLLTGIPAFVVAWIGGLLLQRLAPSVSSDH